VLIYHLLSYSLIRQDHITNMSQGTQAEAISHGERPFGLKELVPGVDADVE
jgi:hypothetical protein